jgi:RNAse (barnase) inhibitor barstar
MQKQVLVVDGSRFSTLEAFFDEVKRELIPDVAWGRNLDAFNDILSGGFGTPDEGFILVWKSAQFSRERLSYDETARVLKDRLAKCHRSARATVAHDLEAARQQIGPTVFDWLVEIIRERDDIELRLD